VLTDTHTLVWALSDPALLSSAAKTVLSKADVTVSVANLWELVLKMHRKQALLADPLPWWDKYVRDTSIPTLSIRTSHVAALAHLPEIHKDPFDRILVAQSKAENLPLVSKDASLAQYGITIIW
jgi:PIN domain nuclease of toxin-antitoxin system